MEPFLKQQKTGVRDNLYSFPEDIEQFTPFVEEGEETKERVWEESEEEKESQGELSDFEEGDLQESWEIFNKEDVEENVFVEESSPRNGIVSSLNPSISEDFLLIEEMDNELDFLLAKEIIDEISFSQEAGKVNIYGEPGGGRITIKKDPVPSDIVEINSFRKIPVHKFTKIAWESMVAAARSSGFPHPLLLPTSGYRSTKHQKVLWERALKKYGSEAEARKWVAKPGGSAHHSGRALDLYLGSSNNKESVEIQRKSSVYRWLRENAKSFGFFPYEMEPWHWEHNPLPDFILPIKSVTTNYNLPSDIDLQKAINLNRKYAKEVGWIKYYSQINDLLLETIGQEKITLNEEAFAKAVAAWQEKKGFGPKQRDGIIGPDTWRKMQFSLKEFQPPGSHNTANFSSTEVSMKRSFYLGMNGLSTSGIARPNEEHIKNENDIITACVSEVEGGFDTVNMYDKGILSWGIMQWTAHAGSLQKILAFIKPRFLQQVGLVEWQKLFGGLDVNMQKNLVFEGKEYPITKEKLPLLRLFRGSEDVNLVHYDDTTMRKWIKIFALAGRHPLIQRLQMEFTVLEMERSANVQLGNFLVGAKRNIKFKKYIKPEEEHLKDYRFPISQYLGNKLKNRMLYFGMWTNNPTWSIIKLFDAIESFMKKRNITNKNPNIWPAGWENSFADEFEKILRTTTVGFWGDEKANKAGRAGRTCKLLKKLYIITKAPSIDCMPKRN